MADLSAHWNEVFETKSDDEVSWFQAEPTTSLRLLNRWASPNGSVVDVGAGASTLVASLLDAGWTDVTALDVSESALEKVRSRLGKRAAPVHFVVGDVRSWQPRRTFDAWHDRAVFHFLVEPTERDRYVAMASHAIAPRGVLVLATFAADGPTSCSGLPTCRYDPVELIRVFGPDFALEHAEREEHHTPFGTIQPFSWIVLRRQ